MDELKFGVLQPPQESKERMLQSTHALPKIPNILSMRGETHTQGGCILTKRDSYIEGLHGYLYNDEKYAKS